MKLSNDTIVLFDMGRVLVTIDFDAFPNALGLFSKEERMKYAPAAMKMEHLYECGKISTQEFLDAQFEIFEKRFSREQLLSAYNEIIVEENSTIIPLVKKIQQHYRTALLSNTSETHWEKSLAIAPILQTIPNKFTSFQIGAMKPAPIVYETVIQSLGVDASSILFIDDVQENIDGAKALGMNGILYTTVEKLEEEINQMLF
jgi:putative hydrolase of the HAD superfamily